MTRGGHANKSLKLKHQLRSDQVCVCVCVSCAGAYISAAVSCPALRLLPSLSVSVIITFLKSLSFPLQAPSTTPIDNIHYTSDALRVHMFQGFFTLQYYL